MNIPKENPASTFVCPQAVGAIACDVRPIVPSMPTQRHSVLFLPSHLIRALQKDKLVIVREI
jgi:hypothetical protein